MGVSMAQDLGQATELFNNAGITLQEGNETAAGSFQQAIDMATKLGEEVLQLLPNVKQLFATYA